MELVQELSQLMGDPFESVADILIPSVLRLCARANKVFVTSAVACITTCIQSSLIPSLVPIFFEAMSSSSKSLRQSGAFFLSLQLQVSLERGKSRIEPYVETMEAAIRLGISDSTSDVRETCKKIFETYRILFDLRLERYEVACMGRIVKEENPLTLSSVTKISLLPFLSDSF